MLLLPGGHFFRNGFLEIIQRHFQARFELDLRFPAQQLTSFGDIGPSLSGIVLRQRFVADLAFRASHLYYVLGAFEDGELVRVANVHRQMFRELPLNE